MKTFLLVFVVAFFAFHSVSAQTQDLLQVEQNVRNLTKQNFSWANAASAEPGDRIEMQIAVTWVGDVLTQNVLVKEMLGQGLQYEGNLKINGSNVAGNVTTENINIGNFENNQTKIVTFEVTVLPSEEFTVGNVTAINSSTAFNADAAASVVSRVEVARAGVPTDISTGPLSLWMVGFAMVLVFAVAGAGAYVLGKQYMNQRVLPSEFENRVDRKLATAIGNIKKKEKKA